MTTGGDRWTQLKELDEATVHVHQRCFDEATLGRWQREVTLALEPLWQPTFIEIYGKTYEERRRVLGFGDDGTEYVYSGRVVDLRKWNEAPVLLEIRQKVTELCRDVCPDLPEPNYCLINLYRDGEDKIGPHSDDETSLDGSKPIVSLSLGDARRFLFHHRRTGKIVHEVMLRHGTCLIMGENTQRRYKHSVPPMKNHHRPRLSFTWRWVQQNKK